MFSIDLHAHTRFFHGFRGQPTVYDPLGVRLLSRVAHWRKLDGVALTNHDYYHRFDTTIETMEFIPGNEISTTKGHVLVIGPDPPTRTQPETLTPSEAVSLAHDRNCVAVIAHPYRGSQILDSSASFDAVEVNGKHPQTFERVRTLARERELPIVGGSDAHFPFEVGRVYTEVDCDTMTPESVVDAIRDGRVEPRIHQGVSHRILQKAYHYVHRAKERASPTVP